MSSLETRAARLENALLYLVDCIEQKMSRTGRIPEQWVHIEQALTRARDVLGITAKTDAPCPLGDAAAHVPLSVSSSTPAGVSRVAPSDAEASGLPSGTADLETVLLPKLAELETALHDYINQAFQIGVRSRDGEVAALQRVLEDALAARDASDARELVAATIRAKEWAAIEPVLQAACIWESMIEENATDGIILAQNELQDAVRAYRGKEPVK